MCYAVWKWIMKIVMDSDVLIKITKTGSKEIVVNSLEVIIPKRVHEETVIESEDSPDARTIQENINEEKRPQRGVGDEKDNQYGHPGLCCRTL